MRLIFTLILSALLFNSCGNPPPQFSAAIHNVNIIDLETGEILKDQSVFIAGDTIHSIIKSKDLLTSSAAQQIDGSGKYLMTGLWDNHVHFRGGKELTEENKKLLNLFIANGITTVRDAGGDLTTAVKEWQKQITDGNLVGPTIYTSGPKIDGPGATWAGSLEVSNNEEINTALDSLAQLNVDFVKIYDSKINGENYLKVIAEAEKRGMITSGHMPYSVTVEETTNAGIDAIEHLYYVLKGCSIEEIAITEAVKNNETGFWNSLDRVMKTYSDSVAQETFSKLKENDVFVVPTLHIGHTLSHLDETDHTTDEYLKYIGPRIQKTYAGRINSAKNASPEFIIMRKNLDSAFVKLAGELAVNNVKLLAGSDSGAFNSYTYPGISLHKELKALVDAGLTPLQALQTSASNGSKFLQKQLPEIKSGAAADLVLLNSNPLENIQNTQDIFIVVKSGKTLSSEDLENLLKTSTY
ncbi:imidazolonepropionase-like amidohydrolase [Leeuwenhoekiella aestuarii]|uniref:Imidazolonepropionase-like amidohydrolase n=1 Tax=Leeuwenhoekiella aestuarii TaxID=2249426 RepID=A0A4Q0NW40_9FLAO|nr:amidohydrolase family protein [Leeuwenhoekiella aestuarii]RXG15592.1 imidazolonepropionase-like amidohydrolase [Leeuwenhoekiella aestuarii]RXG17299.1 imidazolonepropionase-like amidohydrolase [Leeuwenhoekiella aestuarii]